MNEQTDSLKEKVLYLFVPGLLGWGVGSISFFMEIHIAIIGVAMILLTPFFLGLLNRIDRKSYFENNFNNPKAAKWWVYVWNAGILLLFASLTGGIPGN